jgi:hypothetical protein
MDGDLSTIVLSMIVTVCGDGLRNHKAVLLEDDWQEDILRVSCCLLTTQCQNKVFCNIFARVE